MTAWGKTQSTQGDFAVIYKGNFTGMDFADVKLEDLKECDEFFTVANGTVLGNMNREGNRKQVVCNKGFIIKNGSDISQCKNGTWTPKPTCVPECESGWRKHGDACYLFVQSLTSADEANITCANSGAKLLTIPTKDDTDFISTSDITETMIWTGLRMKDNVWQDMFTNQVASYLIYCDGVTHKCVFIKWSSARVHLNCYSCTMGASTACKKPFGI
ncbi:hypothetical protein DPMN_094687 [Dreissena polymorpha]|uniref:Sushi domain-containing protein n=1 Tax=Dreissena polymorpha TaxID=45954 RepID=A0A9D4L5I1_DREPO|nr:hypothetical protein DPMN_094687 [Dreissena polymorpha]